MSGGLGRIKHWALAGLLGAVLLSAPPAAGQKPLTAPTEISVQASALRGFEVRDSNRRRFGPLTFRGGLVLKSPARDFGGISSIRVARDGAGFLAVTDRGQWLRGRIAYAGGVPTGIADAEMAPMLGPDGRSIRTHRLYDSEALADDGGTVYVGFERRHQIVRFDYGRRGLRARGEWVPSPAGFRGMPSNGGIEGMVMVPRGMPLAGTLIALSERALDGAGNIKGFLIGAPNPGIFTVKRSHDFDITDAALTPNGDLLILERTFTLFGGPGMRIRRVPLAQVRPGAVIDGVTLIEADAGYEIDNMEGLSVHQDSGGATVLTIVSDDNFSAFQRTLLLQFTLSDDSEAR